MTVAGPETSWSEWVYSADALRSSETNTFGLRCPDRTQNYSGSVKIVSSVQSRVLYCFRRTQGIYKKKCDMHRYIFDIWILVSVEPLSVGRRYWVLQLTIGPHPPLCQTPCHILKKPWNWEYSLDLGEIQQIAKSATLNAQFLARRLLSILIKWGLKTFFSLVYINYFKNFLFTFEAK